MKGELHLLLFLLCSWSIQASFLVQHPSTQQNHRTPLLGEAFSSQSPSLLRGTSSDGDYALLQERVQEMRLVCLERDWQRPPNAALTAEQFCTALLDSLQTPDDPWPDAGFRTLLRCSTNRWRGALYKSVGAPLETSPEMVASALASALSQRHNRYRLLVQPRGVMFFDFPKEPLDFYDGTCWMECRLMVSSKKGVVTAVMLGFSLVQERGAWMLDDLIWQDLQDQPRSGWHEQTWR